MKRGYDGLAKKQNKINKKTENTIEWSMEQDVYLRQLVCKDKIENWTTICRRFNRKFPNNKQSSKTCKNRWTTLNSRLTLNEELTFILAFYRGNIDIASFILKDKLDVYEYIAKLVNKINSIAHNIKESLPLSLVTKLQFFTLIDLALNQESISNAQLRELRYSKNDWLELVQYLIKGKEKMTKESFHEFVQKIVENIEDRVNLLLEQITDNITSLMHERKENPQQERAYIDPSIINPYMRMRGPRMNFNFMAGLYERQGMN